MLGKRKVRKFAFELMFGYEFNKEQSPMEYYNVAYDNFICLEDEEESVKYFFFGVCEKIKENYEMVSVNLRGWKMK